MLVMGPAQLTFLAPQDCMAEVLLSAICQLNALSRSAVLRVDPYKNAKLMWTSDAQEPAGDGAREPTKPASTSDGKAAAAVPVPSSSRSVILPIGHAVPLAATLQGCTASSSMPSQASPQLKTPGQRSQGCEPGLGLQGLCGSAQMKP